MKKLFGLIGSGIKYTLSPQIHNTVFRVKKIEAEYHVLDISEHNFDNEITNIFRRYMGLNVTIPYKVRILKYITEFTREAEETGAVNTVKIVHENEIIGHNTDVYGIEKALERNRISIRGMKCLVLGAGGAARAAVYVFNKLGVSKIVVANRSTSRSVELREHFKRFGIHIDVVPWDSRIEYAIKSDLIINCTPVGTQSQESPLPEHVFNSNQVVIDMVYRPRMTCMLRYAMNRGAKIVDGLTILIYQALTADEFWLNIDIEEDIFDVVERELMRYTW